MQKQHEGE